jgi:hypothetical protein
LSLCLLTFCLLSLCLLTFCLLTFWNRTKKLGPKTAVQNQFLTMTAEKRGSRQFHVSRGRSSRVSE